MSVATVTYLVALIVGMLGGRFPGYAFLTKKMAKEINLYYIIIRNK